jgi:hypothetical protein
VAIPSLSSPLFFSLHTFLASFPIYSIAVKSAVWSRRCAHICSVLLHFAFPVWKALVLLNYEARIA